MRKSLSGFTIVELLIVIVVIAILAAISIVAYSGIQQRARNSQIVAGVKAYEKALLSYAAVNSSYPSQVYLCLGDYSPLNECWVGPSGTFEENSTFDTLLEPYLGGTKPVLSTNRLHIGGSDYRAGAILFPNPTRRIVYYLEGTNVSCPIGVFINSSVQGTQCSLDLPIN